MFRPIALAYAALLVWVDRDDLVRPSVVVVVFAALGAWTVFTMGFRRVTLWTTLVDLGLASAGIMATAGAYSLETTMAGALTLPGIWSCAGVVSAAIHDGPRGGIIGAVVISIADLASVRRPNFGTIHNIVLLLLIGSLIGLAIVLARQSQTRLEAAVAAEQAYAERERLSRAVHDGVLQTLSYINRRGHEIGGASAPLADLAAEQERSLRTLVGGMRAPGPTTEDLTGRLRAMEAPGVSLSMPAEPVTLPADRAEEVAAAVAAAIDNVRRHAGPAAKAWVLLEDLGAEVAVTVRDNGVGMAPSRLAAAADEGRLGASASISGRLEDLGGSADWRTAPGAGCTVTLRAPKYPGPAARVIGGSR